MITSGFKIFSELEEDDILIKKRGAKASGLPVCPAIHDFLDKAVIDADKQRMVSMFFGQQAYEETVFDDQLDFGIGDF